MDTLRTENTRCTKRSCKTVIPPPRPNERDYSTCEACRARDAVSKKRKREGAAGNSGQQHVPGPPVVEAEKSNQTADADAERP